MEKTERTRLTNKRWARITAFVLFILMIPVMLFCFIDIAIAFNQGWYRPKPVTFYESSFCKTLVNDDTWAVWNNRWNYEEYEQKYDNNTGVRYTDSSYTNFLYVLKDKDGNVLEQNCDGELAIQVRQNYDYLFEGKSYYIDTYVRCPLDDNIRDDYWWSNKAFELCYEVRNAAPYAAAASLVVEIALLVFLLKAAGRREENDNIALNWQDRMPFDLYIAVVGTMAALLLALMIEGSYMSGIWPCVFYAVIIPVEAAICISFLMTLVVRVKSRTLIRNTLVVRWGGAIVRWLKRACYATMSNLPLLWKLILGFAVYLVINALLALLLIDEGSFIASLCLLVFNGATLFALCKLALQMLALKKAGETLANGDLTYKTDTGKLVWEFREHGESLNRISEGMARAVDDRMRSERFKTELITNVSHDIKTPLTSIISYVDLLKREEINNKKACEYIEILDRQSSRLKKLTEDLIEASKASTGAVNVNPERVDITELLRQTAGEYSQRLEKAGITTVLSVPESGLFVLADGRHLWRVFDNLMSNICKYAMRGTRAYLSAEAANGKVYVMFRNISEHELNISADELMERFVRGDTSRSTEGSGLGLSIAKSLTELMGGKFSIYLDGDLFKIMLTLNQLD